MKFSRLHKILFVTVGIIAGVFFACNEFDYVEQPENVYLDETVTVHARLNISPSTNDTATLLFGIYAPKSLDLANNATVVFNTVNFEEVLGADYGVVDITNEVLTVVPADEKAPHSPYSSSGGVTEDQWIPWSDAMLNYYGTGDNASLATPVEMEWIVWESKNPMFISDKLPGDKAHNQSLYATLDITFNAGSEELECYIGYAYLNKTKGFYHDQEHLSNAVWKHFVVEKYEAPKFPSLEMIQSARRYGDIFGMEFSADGTDLEGEMDIYVCGRAVLADGQTLEVTEAIDANRMDPFQRRLPDGTVRQLFEKYIYPPYFFEVPEGATIESVTLWFTNTDGSKVAELDLMTGEPFLIEQTPGSIHDVEEPEVPEEGGEETPEEGGDAPVEA